MTAEETEHGWLYRMFDEAGTLLYVGISSNPAQRLVSHQYRQPWWEAVAQIRFGRLPSMDAAREAERDAIRTERPKHNAPVSRKRGERPIKSRKQLDAERSRRSQQAAQRSKRRVPKLEPAPSHHLAQVNVALLKAPLDSPQLADFVARLEPINRLADTSPGFMWRLQTDEGDATALRVFGDERILINMSVWESVGALSDYVYYSQHLDVLRQRRHWFEKMREAHLALWWLPAGQLPTVEDAKSRLDLIREQGPTQDAFTLRQPYPPPVAQDARGDLGART